MGQYMRHWRWVLVCVGASLVSCGNGTSTEINCEDTTMCVDSIACIDTTSLVVDTTMTESK